MLKLKLKHCQRSREDIQSRCMMAGSFQMKNKKTVIFFFSGIRLRTRRSQCNPSQKSGCRFFPAFPNLYLNHCDQGKTMEIWSKLQIILAAIPNFTSKLITKGEGYSLMLSYSSLHWSFDCFFQTTNNAAISLSNVDVYETKGKDKL